MTPTDLLVRVDTAEHDHECDACTDRLVDALRTHDGVIAAESAGRAQVRVTYDSDRCTPVSIDKAIAQTAGELSERFGHDRMTVGGMDCSSCAQKIERAVGRVEGVTSCSVNYHASALRYEFERAHDDAPRATVERIKSLGYDPRPEGAEADDIEGATWVSRHREELVTAISFAFMMAAVVAGQFDAPRWLELGLYGLAIVVGGASIARSGISGLIATHRPDMKLLMTIAVVGAVAIDAWLEAALVVVLFSVGEALESYAVNRARSSLASLVEMVPSTARVRRTLDDGTVSESDVAVSELVIGDTVVVLPGEQVPADGAVSEGASAVNQASITGESVPVDKQAGDEVFAGTLNGEGRLLVTVGSAPGDTTLDRIARAVTEAQAQKAPSERWVDSFAAIYTPVVMVIAFAIMLVPPLVVGGDFSEWFYLGLTFLILACPCALVISTPVAVVSALGRASAAGVLIKGGQHLEAAAGIRAVCLDKTGTITAGRPAVATIEACEGSTEQEVLELAAAVEAGSEHPLAAAVLDHARNAGVVQRSATDVEASRGFGVTGVVDGRTIMVGSGRFFAEHPDARTAAVVAERLQALGHTLVMVADERRVLGAIGLQDTPRPTSAAAIADLHEVGVERVVLLTGDHAAAAAAISSQVGIDDIHAQLLPEDKVERLATIEREYESVAMVGDGVNDAPALARATVGVAMGTGGSATAIETADIALIGDDLQKLAGTIGLARWTRAVVRQNIAFSLGTKAIAAALAIAGLLTLWMAVLVDVGATVVVVANGLRLLRTKPSIGALRGLPMLGIRSRSTDAR